MNSTARYLTILGMLLTVAWFFWNPDGWEFEWEPIVAFTLTLAGFIATEVNAEKETPESTRKTNDALLFGKLIEALPPNGSMRFIREWDFLGSFLKSDIEDIGRFVYEWDNAHHEFSDKKIESLRQTALEKAKAFNLAIAKNTSRNRAGLQAVRKDCSGYDEATEERYKAEAREIHDAADALSTAYDELVREGKRCLALNQV